jgi:hypothetical protein
MISFDPNRKVRIENIRAKTVFLGGTCNDSTWRDVLTALLDKNRVDVFNPVVKDWTNECRVREMEARMCSDYVLYVITPKMTGIYSIAEVVDDSNKRPNRTLFCVLSQDGENMFTPHQVKSLKATELLVRSNGALVFDGLEEVAQFLNS